MSLPFATLPEATCLGQAMLTALAVAGASARMRLGNKAAWQEISARLAYLPVDYSSAMIDYQLAYWSGVGFPTADISLVLVHDSRPCGIWPLSVTRDADGKMRIGSSGTPVVPPLFVASLARKSVKFITAACLKALESVCDQIGQSCIESIEGYIDGDGLPEWHDHLMQRGARVELRHDLFLDLHPSMAEIKCTFRKSYKALVTSGGKLWKVQIETAGNVQVWDEFRLLHREVAGRVTRSEESWNLQHEVIVSGDAFFVYLRNDEGRMVGGGLFHVTPHEGLYAIGAYDRSLFDKPLGHVVQYYAIEEMKRRGMRWYRLGARSYSADTPAPSDKEISISNFKQGFASHLFPRYWIRYERRQE